MAQGPHARAPTLRRRRTPQHPTTGVACATVHRAARFVFSLWAGLSLHTSDATVTSHPTPTKKHASARKRAHRGGSAWGRFSRRAATNEQRSPRPGLAALAQLAPPRPRQILAPLTLCSAHRSPRALRITSRAPSAT